MAYSMATSHIILIIFHFKGPFVINKTLKDFSSNVTKRYIEKKLTSNEIMILMYVISETSSGKKKSNVTTVEHVQNMFKLKKQRVLQIMNKLKEHDYVQAIYKATTLKTDDKTFITYNKARAYQKREGGQVYFYGVKLIDMSKWV